MWLVVWSAVVGLAVLLALVLGPSIYKARQEFKSKLLVHRRRTRKIYGCFKCGKELFGDQFRHTCGTCAEDTAFCDRCARNPGHPHALYREAIDWEVDPSDLKNARCVSEAFSLAFSIYSSRACIGWREEKNGRLGDNYTWITYSDVAAYASVLGRGLKAIGVPERSKALLWGVASRDWYLADYALFLHQHVPIPLHASASVNAVAHIMKLAKPTVMFVSAHLCATAERARNLSGVNIALVVALQDPAEPYALRSEENSNADSVLITDALAPMTVLSLQQVANMGLRAAPESFSPTIGDGSDIVMLLPTSGSSGLPKLTIITDRMLLMQARPPDFGVPTVMFSFEPLRQSLDVLAKGGRIGVYSGSLARLHDDMRILRPTVFGATPVLWQGLCQAYQAALNEALRGAHSKSEQYAAEKRITEQWKEKRLLGNRCRLAIIGGAASSPALRSWIFSILSCVVVDGYGTTETGGLAGSGDVKEGTTLQLIDCPELGYRTSDKPWPRGEIVARTSRMTPGYYADEEATAERFVQVGGLSFFRTGDVGEMVQGKLTVIDRRNAIFKLAHGVFVAPAPLEELYGKCNLLSSVFVFGDPLMHAIAVACVLAPGAATSLQVEATQAVLTALRDLGREAHRAAWEIPGQVIIDEQPWTPENGLLSSIGKLCRPALRARFMPRGTPSVPVLLPLDDTYRHNKSAKSPSEAISDASNSELSSGLCQVLLAAIPSLSPSLLLPTTRLVDLGADSLAFARLAAQLKERFGTQLPLPQLVRLPTLLHLQFAVFSGGVGVASLLKELEGSTPSLDWPAEAAQACAELDVDLKFRPEASQGDAVFLTGSTGFFGAFLLAALLAEPAHRTRKVICVARAPSDAEARKRVLANLKLYGLDSEVDAARIEALAGDVGQPRFALSEVAYAELISRVACVVHNAAVVTSALPYASLKPANVNGTAHVTRLAAAAGAPLHHISTIGLLAGSGILEERAEVPPVALSLLSGYAQSKWVAERLVYHARKRGLKARLYRAGTLAGHSRTGACNLQDTVTRLLLGLRAERMCCVADDSPLPRLFPLIASDWAAAAVAQLTATPIASESEDEAMMHVVSRTPQSLDDLVEAVEAAGTPLTRVSASEFRDRISAVSESHPLFVFKTVLSGAGYASGGAASLPDDARLRSRLRGTPTATPVFNGAMLKRSVQWAAQQAQQP